MIVVLFLYLLFSAISMYIINRNLTKIVPDEILIKLNGWHLFILGLVWPYYVYKYFKG